VSQRGWRLFGYVLVAFFLLMLLLLLSDMIK